MIAGHPIALPSDRQRTVLVVEDEWLVRMEIADALEAAGWTIAEAASGEEAIGLLLSSARFDLLVTDIRLDGSISGWDVAETFRAALPDIAVIYASANPPITARQVAGSLFIGKPSLMSAMVEAGERLWRPDPAD